MQRRRFLQSAAAVAAAPLILRSRPGKAAPYDRIGVAVIGLRGRGNNLLESFRDQPDVEVRILCDVDSRVLAKRTEETEQATGRKPEGVKDFRQTLDDDSIDAVILGTPDHWHAIPTILACQAGKDVYVEKPDGHNILEGRAMVAAQKKYARVVQLGTQTRNASHFKSAMAYIREGKLGKVRLGKAWESAQQGDIGRPPDGEPPEGVDYDFWLGPAPLKPFNPKRFHSSWRWFLDYGCGDLGNDGVHRLDITIAGLREAAQAEGRKIPHLPKRVSSLGGKLYFDDAQEWPDTQMVTYEFDDYILTYEMRLWSPTSIEGTSGEGAAIYGDAGHLVFSNDGWTAYDGEGKPIAQDSSNDAGLVHVRDFLDCMRSRNKTTADLETIGHSSSLLCHIGNASWRSGRTLNFDPATYQFLGDADADQFLTRPVYRKPWTLPDLKDI